MWSAAAALQLQESEAVVQRLRARVTSEDNCAWDALMAAAQGGDASAYNRLLSDVAVWLRRYYARRLPAVIGLGLLMRRGAPTDRGGTALAAGLAAAAWGAFVFVFACPFDDPFYVAVWYSLGCGAVTLFARFALPPLTRW